MRGCFIAPIITSDGLAQANGKDDIMSKIAVVYWSATGNTEAMANEVAEGAKAAGAEVELKTAGEFTADDVANYDAIAFGCPAMGAEELEDGEVQPMWDAVKGSLSGKKIGLFGSYDWGDGEWLRLWAEDAASAGVVMAAEPVKANLEPDDDAKAACKALGAALA